MHPNKKRRKYLLTKWKYSIVRIFRPKLYKQWCDEFYEQEEQRDEQFLCMDCPDGRDNGCGILCRTDGDTKDYYHLCDYIEQENETDEQTTES